MFRPLTLAAVVFLVAYMGPACAEPITGIAARNNTNDPILMSAALRDGVLCYSDTLSSVWRDVPSYLGDADYIRTPRNDAANFDFEMDVTLSSPADLYVFVNDVTWGAGPIPWMIDGTFPYRFVDTGDNVTRFTPGAAQPNISHSVFVAEVPAETVTLLWNHDSTGHAPYGVAAVVPEPSTPILVCAVAVGMATFAWRKRKRA